MTSFLKDFKKSLGSSKQINSVFLGVGLCLFFLNIASFLAFVPISYSEGAFNVSVFASIIIILIAVYNLTNN